MPFSLERRSRALLFSGTGTALVLAILAALNFLSHFFFARLDLSAGKATSISRGTREILSQVKDNLVIKVFFTPHLPPPYGLHGQYLRDLLGEYQSAGRGRIRLEFVNPEGNERLKREARDSGILPVQLNVLARDKFEVKEAYMGLVLLYKGRNEAISVVENTRELEYEISRRIRKLASPALKTVGFVTGHGEKGPFEPSLQPLFGMLREQMNVESVSLEKPLSAPVDSLWILGPSQRFKAEEIERLKAWVGSGKSLGILLNRRLVELQSFSSIPLETGLEGLLKAWGVELGEGFVADAQAERIQLETQYGQFVAMRIQEYPFIPVATNLSRDHPATRSLEAVSLPFVHPISFKGGGLRYASLADSSALSWLETTAHLAPGQPLERLEAKPKGPFSLAGVIEGDFYKVTPTTFSATQAQAPQAPGRVILVGTSYQLHQSLANKAANVAFLMNLLEWSFQDEALLSIRAKGMSYRPLRRLSELERRLLKYALIFSLPFTLLLSGFLLHRRRTTRRKLLAPKYAPLDEEPQRTPASASGSERTEADKELPSASRAASGSERTGPHKELRCGPSAAQKP